MPDMLWKLDRKLLQNSYVSRFGFLRLAEAKLSPLKGLKTRIRTENMPEQNQGLCRHFSILRRRLAIKKILSSVLPKNTPREAIEVLKFTPFCRLLRHIWPAKTF